MNMWPFGKKTEHEYMYAKEAECQQALWRCGKDMLMREYHAFCEQQFKMYVAGEIDENQAVQNIWDYQLRHPFGIPAKKEKE